MFPPALYINRDEDVDRRLHMEAQFAQIGLTNYIRFPAFTGEVCSASSFCPPYANKVVDLVNKCLISHLHAIKSLTFDGYDSALIFEDDVVLTTANNWPFTWDEFEASLPKGWDVVQLYINENTSNELPTLPMRKYHPGLYSTLAYLISKEHAKAIVSAYFVGDLIDFEKVNYSPMAPGPYLADRVIYTFNSYSVNLFSTESFVSTILGDVPEKYHKASAHVVRLWEDEPLSLADLLSLS